MLRKIIFVIFAIVIVEAISAAALDGFMGIPWGTNKEKVKSIILAREGVTFNKEISNDDQLYFFGGSFGGKSVNYFIVLFVEDQMCKVGVYFEPKEHQVIEKYYEWKEALTQKYGVPENSFEFFKEPYKKGDGYETLAIRSGKGIFESYWSFPTLSEKQNAMSLGITDELIIVIQYQNGELFSKYDRKMRAKNNKDY